MLFKRYQWVGLEGGGEGFKTQTKHSDCACWASTTDTHLYIYQPTFTIKHTWRRLIFVIRTVAVITWIAWDVALLIGGVGACARTYCLECSASTTDTHLYFYLPTFTIKHTWLRILFAIVRSAILTGEDVVCSSNMCGTTRTAEFPPSDVNAITQRFSCYRVLSTTALLSPIFLQPQQNLLSGMLRLNDRHSSLFLPTDFYNKTHLAPVDLCHPHRRHRHPNCRHSHRRGRRLCIEHVRDKQDSGIPTVRCERHCSTFFMLPCPLNYSTPLADFPLTTAEPTVWNTPPQRQTLIFISTYRLLQ